MIRVTLFLHESVLLLFIFININHNMSPKQLI